MTSGAWSCPSCGTANVATLKFCGECGTKRQRTENTLSGDHTQIGTTPRPASAPDATLGGSATYAGSVSSPTPASALRAGLRAGRDGRYELVAKLGEGGMGAVWKARDLQLGREVAVKRILGHGSAMMRERFQRETQAVVGLRHPNIVTVFDAGEDEHGMYMVMELVPGKSLAAHLQQGAMNPEVAVQVMLGLCGGAAHAHKKGVVHRDIKPGNVMLDEDGVPKLLDFGLVRMEGASELSVAGVGMGTMDYAAPEQKLDASRADARADVYALGLVFYEMLTGLRPPVTIRRVSETWRPLIEKATDSVAADRYASAEPLLLEIEAVRQQASSEAIASQMLGTTDDLRCPKCKLLNALEAKFCRVCSHSLREDCPACSTPIRTGLRQCDQCSASIGLVRQLQEELPLIEAELKDGSVSEAKNRAGKLISIAQEGRLGMADVLHARLIDLDKRLSEQANRAEAFLVEAEACVAREDLPTARAQLADALRLDRGLEGRAATIGDVVDRVQAAKDLEEEELESGWRVLAEALAADQLTHVTAGVNHLKESLQIERKAWHAYWYERCEAMIASVQKRQDQINQESAQRDLQKAIDTLFVAVKNRDVHAAQKAEMLVMALQAAAGPSLSSRVESARKKATRSLRALESSFAMRKSGKLFAVAFAVAVLVGLSLLVWSAWEQQAVEEARVAARIDAVRFDLESGAPGALGAFTSLKADLPGDSRVSAMATLVGAGELQRKRRIEALEAEGFSFGQGLQVDSNSGWPQRIVHRQTGAVLVLVSAGTFQMGSDATEAMRRSEEAMHDRVIRKAFYIGQTEVIQAQWERVMQSNPSQFRGLELPVERVSWSDCQKFFEKVGCGLRLPSEAEWEYACRAGTTSPFSFGGTITQEQVNYDGSYPYQDAPREIWRERTVQRRSLADNSWGLYEMHGNVAEWCEDLEAPYPGHGDERPWVGSGSRRVFRGGGWRSSGRGCRSAQRGALDPESSFADVGFRLAKSLPE